MKNSKQKLFRLCLVFLLSTPFFRAQAESSGVDCHIAEAVIKRASEIRGLKVKSKVPCEVHDKEKVKQYLVDTMATKIPPKHMLMEERAYKAIGMIPEDFDYQKGIVDLYVSQLGGYYDPSERHYIMAAWLPSMMQATVAAHELTHALQDQYYDLGKFMEVKDFTGDELMARSALVEGDATAVMLDYTRELSGQGPIADDPDVNSVLMQNVLGATLVAGFSNIPQSLQMLLLFPYNSGLRFAHHFLHTGGYKNVDNVFRHPPRSTEEILHPEKYGVTQKDFIDISEADVRPRDASPALKMEYSDVLGEFSISALLSIYEPDRMKVAQAAAGWGGDRVFIFDSKEASMIVWRTHWDTQKDADEFFEVYSTALEKRFPGKGFKAATKEWVETNTSRHVKFVKNGQNVELFLASES